jgi:hypothetical protein
VSFTSGISGAFGYFTWPNVSRTIIAYILTFTSIGAIFAYYAAVSVHSRRRNASAL